MEKQNIVLLHAKQASAVYTVDCGKLSLFLWGLRIRIFF